MYKWQPGKWLQFAIVGAGLPWLAGSWLSTDSLVSDISTRAAAAAGNWAKVQMDGRDATLSGTAESDDAAKAAIAAVQSLYGVRLVNTDGVKVAPPAPLASPTVDSVSTDGPTPEFKGTWPEGKAKTLDVTVNDKTFSLGKDAELTSNAGNWDLKLAQPLPPGTYAVTATAGDGAKQTVAAAKPGQLVVAEPLAAPTVDSISTDGPTPEIKGTWPEGKAKTLDVTVNDKTFSLGKDAELTSNAGNWDLKLPGPLAAGTYAVSAAVGDGAKQTVAAAKPGQLVVAEAPKPAEAPAAKPLSAPTIETPKVEEGKPVTLSGTWPVGAAQSFSVAVNNQPYQLGKDYDLVTDTAGKWLLKLKPDLAPGHYDVVATATGADGKALDAKASFDIAAAAAAAPAAKPPAAPTVESATSDSDHPTVKGTWPVGNGNTLQVELDGVTHTLGKDYDLLSDTAGHWILKPAKPVVNGTYDVVAKVIAPDGQSTIGAASKALTVNVAAPPPPPPAAEAYDCEGTMARIAAVFPIRFEFNHDDLAGAYPNALGQYAALLKDARCTSLKVQVAGHADYIGSEAFNQGLSERRAQTVIDALTKAGIDKARLTGIGYGKTKPLDPAHSNDARAKNRRVEFSIVK
ncbi:MAG: OmpA family protein [Alphaproteobacteria bacterium]|nr:OmpA family protein [Alphaproteobacteria bacterium]